MRSALCKQGGISDKLNFSPLCIFQMSSSGTVQCECAIKAAYQIYWTFLHSSAPPIKHCNHFNNQTARSTVRQDMPEIPACWYCQNVVMMVVMIITIIMIIMVKMTMIMKRSVFIIMLCWWWWLWVLENWGNFAPNPSPSSSSQGPGRRA